MRANRKLHAQGYGLLIFDGYRPWYVTKMFWDGTPAEDHLYVADPAKGSKHNRGCAVDLTVYDLRTGQPLDMPSGYDEMSERAHSDYAGGTAQQNANRALLRNAMEAEGFTVNPDEWWHFDYKDWRAVSDHECAVRGIEAERGKLKPPDWAFPADRVLLNYALRNRFCSSLRNTVMSFEESRPRLPAVTSLRFFAAFHVALFHMNEMGAHHRPALVEVVRGIGYVGVSFFFVLSGFILVYTYAGRDDRPARLLADTLRPHLSRIPVFAAAFVSVFLFRRAQDARSVLRVCGAALRAGVGAGAAAAAVVDSGSGAGVELGGVEPFGGSVLLRGISVRAGEVQQALTHGVVGIDSGVLVGWAGDFGRIPAFAARGDALREQRQLVERGAVREVLPRWCACRNFSWAWRAASCFCAASAIPSTHCRWWALGLLGVAATTVASRFVPYLVVHTALSGRHLPRWSTALRCSRVGPSWLNNRVLVLFGNASYSFYLLHTMFVWPFFHNMQTQAVRNQGFVGIGMWLVMMLTISSLVYRFIEEPARRKLRPHKKAIPAPVEALPSEG